jgi:hypothetical protein
MFKVYVIWFDKTEGLDGSGLIRGSNQQQYKPLLCQTSKLFDCRNDNNRTKKADGNQCLGV